MKARTHFVMLAAIALLASCSTEQMETPSIPQEETGKVYLEVTAAQPATPQTRMTYAGDESTDATNGEGITATWSLGDKLAVVSYSGEYMMSPTPYLLNEPLAAQTAGNPATFTGTITTPSTDGMTGLYSFYYPAVDEDDDIGVIDPEANTVTYDYTLQTNTLTTTDEGATYVADPNDMSRFDVLCTNYVVDNLSLGISLTRASSIIRFVLTLPANAPAINSISLTANQDIFYQKLQLEVGKILGGIFPSGQGNPAKSLSLKVTGDKTSTSARTITAYMLIPYDANTSTATSVKVSAISGDRSKGEATVYSYDYKDYFKTNSQNLFSEYTYTFTTKLTKEEVVWAGSNIYWDSKEQQLTFAPAGTSDYDASQGVFFKWGSLVGISPAQYNSSDSWSGNETIYIPTYNTGTSKWSSYVDYASHAGYATYADIPYEGDNELRTGASQNNLYYADAKKQADQWAAYKGDICQFIGEVNPTLAGYRMPRQEEFGDKTDWEAKINPGDTWGTNNALGNASGTFFLVDKGRAVWKGKANFPTAGYRDSDGKLGRVGDYGCYWSSSARGADVAFELMFNENGASTLSSSSDLRQMALPIRCVKN
jgi:hypothetical protein